MLERMLRPGLGVIQSRENFSRLQAAPLGRLAERLRGREVQVVYHQRTSMRAIIGRHMRRDGPWTNAMAPIAPP